VDENLNEKVILLINLPRRREGIIMPTLKQRLDVAIDAYRKEREAQTKKEIDEMREKARKINARAKTTEEKKKAQQELTRAKQRLSRAKSKGKREKSIFDFLG
jgi:CRISPR/Cas system-associated endonuclease Cas3-HD